MNVFVAGGTGVLGRSVVRLLVSAGHAVRVLSRSGDNEKTIRALGAEPAFGSLFDMSSLARLVEGSEAVLHLATKIPLKVRPAMRDFAENDRLRTEGTAKLLEAARMAGTRIYIQQSIAFLPATRDPALLADDAPCVLPAPEGSITYAAVKMEELVRHANGRNGLSSMILRGGLFYHAESAQIRQMIGAIRRRRLPIFGPGENVVSPIHVDDMASAVLAAMERPAAGETFFVVDDHPVRFKDFINTVARLAGARPAPHWPGFLARPILGPVMGILPRISFNCSNRKFRWATGWTPRFPDLESGMSQVLSRL